MNEGISLYDLQKRVKGCIDPVFTHQIWIRGEISGIKSNPNGHCYLDLVDKEQDSDSIRAKGQAVIWSSSWKVLRPYFENSTGSSLSPGMAILVKAQVQYSELYGLSLIISDIDPSFSVGEMELRRREVAARLKKEGMFDMNTTLELPSLPRRFAVISSDTAAGYRDFQKHLGGNEYGFSFYTKLFPAPMQGASAPEGIILALDAILEANAQEKFDAVLLLRGGGSSIDLSCFDDYSLSANIAQFPLPVMVAVGHDQDYHICDMVACVSVKTPTALADYIVDIFVQEDAHVTSLASRLSLALANKFSDARGMLNSKKEKIAGCVRLKLLSEQNRISLLEHRLTKGNPLSLLEAGYCLMEKGGVRIFSASSLKKGEHISLIMKDGEVNCLVNNLKINK